MSERQQHASAGAATAVQIPAAPTQTSDAPVYHLQLQPRARVTFTEDVVDNEHLGRKKSNKCCVFHKKREFGESSSESGEDSSDDDNDSDSEGDDSRPSGTRRMQQQHKHKHKRHHTCAHNHNKDDSAKQAHT